MPLPCLAYARQMDSIATLTSTFATLAWGPWLLVLLLGGGLYFLIYSRLIPFRNIRHGVQILMGKYDDSHDTGQITHFQALSGAMAGTIGMGNLSGVAIAIQTGGPGAVFWMWLCATLGIATKFFTCTCAIQFRGPDSRGAVQGGPMYTILYGLGKRWKPLGSFFAICALGGTLPLLQANQLTQILREVVAIPEGWVDAASRGEMFAFNLVSGLAIAAITGAVIIGGIERIGQVTSKIVPAMISLYFLTAIVVLMLHLPEVPSVLKLIVTDAFTGHAVAGGAVGSVIITGVRRAAFSNEAGMGTEALVHGAAKTEEPTREGLVAMLGPIIDTLLVCSFTAVIILCAETWKNTEHSGVTVTTDAFEKFLPGFGAYLMILIVLCFSISTILSYAYYGEKSLGFLIGAERQHYFRYFYTGMIVVASVISLTAVIDFTDGMFAMMAIPTMTSALLLSPRVMDEARRYFKKMEAARASGV